MSRSNNLMMIVQINEQIKKIVFKARVINLLALNAILLSRRAGSLAMGFAFMSSELRQFSKQLTTQMELLSTQSFHSVTLVSQSQKYDRINQLLQKTAFSTDHNQLKQRLLNSNHQLDLIKRHTQHEKDKLKASIEEALLMGRFGSIIARSLKIEATYGDVYTESLTGIANEFSEHIETIAATINNLYSNLRSSYQN